MAGQYKSGRKFRYLFVVSGIVIAIAFVWVTNVLVDELKKEERKKIETWAESIALMSSQALSEGNEDTDIFNNYDAFLVKLIEGNTTIPVVAIDDDGNIVPMFHKNIEVPETESDEYLKRKAKQFAKNHEPITIRFEDGTQHFVYYDDSTVLKQLQLFPFIQIAIVFIFIIISFLALNSAKRAEQNRIWVGLSKETAHQLGTPISSLMAWVEYLKTKDIDIKLLAEIDKDVQRLKTIAERFSKIGSNPEQEPMDLQEAANNAVEYMQRRISSKVKIDVLFPQESIVVMMNESLFGWILENLIKNAVDAMDGQGKIKLSATLKGKKVFLDIADTGKGIPKSRFKTVFQPGYTTKKRGWGLGLSLVKRIIESYRNGKIYVYKSEPSKGTTFRIEMERR